MLSSILIALCIALTFVSSSTAQDPGNDPHQGDSPDHEKAQHKTRLIFNIQYSPDGTKIAIAGLLGIRLCDAYTGKELDFLTVDKNLFLPISVVYCPDGKMLASGCRLGIIHLWDTKTGVPQHTLSGHKKAVLCVAYSPDGKTLASVGADKTLHLWNANTGQLLRTLKGHKKPIVSVSYNPDGTIIVTGSEDRTIRLWDASTGQHIQTLKWDKRYIRSVVFSPDGNTIAAVSRDSTISHICLWDANTGQQIRTLSVYTQRHSEDSKIHAHGTESNSITFSPDGRTIACACFSDTHQWDVATGEHLRTLEGQQWWTFNVAFSPDGSTIASASALEVLLWDAKTGQLIKTLISRF